MLLRRAFSAAKTGKYQLPDLPYSYDALEPVISGEIMKIHHQKHHQTYVNNLNAALGEWAQAEHANDLVTQTMLIEKFKFNAGGNINHSIFWKNLCPPNKAKGQPGGPLLKAIENEFGTFDAFKAYFVKHTASVQGSGWGWLGYNKMSKRVQFEVTRNQDPLAAANPFLLPLLGVDVWEHAYYLQYKNARPDYLQAIWSVINWEDVQHRFDQAIKPTTSTEAQKGNSA